MTSSTPDALWASRSLGLLRPAAIEVRGLRRAIGGRTVLDGIDLTVPAGSRLLLVSQPEGAASLLLRILAGLVRPASGGFRLAGLARGDDGPSGWTRRVAYAGPDTALYPWLTPREVLALAAGLAGYPGDERAGRLRATAVRFGLDDDLDRPLAHSSPQLAQRTLLAAALMGEPEIVLLDEPLRSLDAAQRARLLQLPGRRRTLLLASRYPASEDGLVDRVALIRDGRLALHAPIEELERHGLPLSLRGIAALADVVGPARGGGRPALAPPA